MLTAFVLRGGLLQSPPVLTRINGSRTAAAVIAAQATPADAGTCPLFNANRSY